MRENAEHIWCDDHGEGRNVYVVFRRVFEIEDEPTEGMIHLFGDTRYRLRVNGVIAAHGPARFVPAFAEYDSVDLMPCLRPGRNVIAVEVNSYGASNYQAMPESRGGFIAWGHVVDGTGATVDLSTPGDWMMRRPAGWDSLSPPFSFAQGPVEISDWRDLREYWFCAAGEDNGWKPPVRIANQQTWGSLSPRTIPALSEDVIYPAFTRVFAPVRDDGLRIPIRVNGLSKGCDPKRLKQGDVCFSYASHIHSPTAQTVELGLFWGDHYLNGELLERHADEVRGARENASAQLKQGWNLLYGEVAVLMDVWCFMLGVPKDAGLTVAAEPDALCPDVLVHTDPLPKTDLAARRGDVPRDADSLQATRLKWNRLSPDRFPACPARDCAWDRPETPILEDSTTVSEFELDFDDVPAYTLLFDYEGEFLGHAYVELDAPAGTIVDVSVDERRRSDGMLAVCWRAFVETSDRMIAGGGRQILEGFHVRGGRYLQISIRKPVDGGGTATIHRVGIRRAQVPVNPTGRFECPDPVFNWAWQAGIDTLQACIEDAYLDCPWRERGTYLGDSRVIMNVHRAVSHDLSVPRRCIRLWAQAQRPDGQFPACAPAWIPHPHDDFSLIWVIMLHDYWSFTGDTSLAEELWPNLQKLWEGSRWEKAESGLWNADDLNVFIDWGATPESKKGDENAALNAFRYRALECSGDLADALGRDDETEAFRQEAAEVRVAFVSRLWRSDKRIVAAAREGSGFLDTGSLHANVLAVLFGLLDDEKREGAVQYVLDGLQHNLERLVSLGRRSGNIEPYFLFYAFAMLYKEGHTGLAEQLVRDHYGYMQDQGAWTLWENMAVGPSRQGSYCHAWVASPNVVAMRHVLGVTQPEPGNPDRLLVAPDSMLPWARGTYPHPKGDVDVEWRRVGDRLFMDIRAPEGIEIETGARGALSACEVVPHFRHC